MLSTFTAVRVYLSEQFPTALRGRGQYFGESCGRLVAGVIAPFLLDPYTGSPTIFFGTLALVASIGAFVPVLFGEETVGQLETVSEGVPELPDKVLARASHRGSSAAPQSIRGWLDCRQR